MGQFDDASVTRCEGSTSNSCSQTSGARPRVLWTGQLHDGPADSDNASIAGCEGGVAGRAPSRSSLATPLASRGAGPAEGVSPLPLPGSRIGREGSPARRAVYSGLSAELTSNVLAGRLSPSWTRPERGPLQGAPPTSRERRATHKSGHDWAMRRARSRRPCLAPLSPSPPGLASPRVEEARAGPVPRPPPPSS